jgi:hypothetical protein
MQKMFNEHLRFATYQGMQRSPTLNRLENEFFFASAADRIRGKCGEMREKIRSESQRIARILSIVEAG